jgi:hypothetical protein
MVFALVFRVMVVVGQVVVEIGIFEFVVVIVIVLVLSLCSTVCLGDRTSCSTVCNGS